MKKLMVALVALMMSVGVWAHSGGTDKNGCHHDRKSSGYHCH
ncbi:YHYH domain-containing protein [Variovorax sp. LjRoot84]